MDVPRDEKLVIRFEEPPKTNLLDIMRKQVKIGNFALASGRESDWYFDGRAVTLDQSGLSLSAMEKLSRMLWQLFD